MQFQKDSQYKIFSCLWAVATIFHLAHFNKFDTEFHYFLLSFAAVYLLVKPASLFRLLLLLLLQLYEATSSLPEISNHWVFTAFVNLTILQALLYLVLKKKTFHINKGELLGTFAPVVRVELIILYFFVVFHKLNESFFSLDVSCATDFFLAQNAYSLLPTATEILSLNAYLTVIVEALIPVLLCFRATRNWGILIGLVFHCIIAYNPLRGFYDFSSTIFAVYFLFSGVQFSNMIYKTWQGGGTKLVWPVKYHKFSFKNLFIIIALFLGGLVLVHILTSRFEDFFRHVFWTIYSFLFIYIFIRSMMRKDATLHKPARSFSLPHWSFIIIPSIVFLNGLSPYLGLKTEYSFAMFSNLRTEGGVSNHYIVPADIQIFDFQKDMVEIVASSDWYLQERANNGELMVWFAFKDYVARTKPARVEYIVGGQQKVFDLNRAKNEGDKLLTSNPYLLRKFLDFRFIKKYGPQPCSH